MPVKIKNEQIQTIYSALVAISRCRTSAPLTMKLLRLLRLLGNAQEDISKAINGSLETNADKDTEGQPLKSVEPNGSIRYQLTGYNQEHHVAFYLELMAMEMEIPQEQTITLQEIEGIEGIDAYTLYQMGALLVG